MKEAKSPLMIAPLSPSVLHMCMHELVYLKIIMSIYTAHPIHICIHTENRSVKVRFFFFGCIWQKPELFGKKKSQLRNCFHQTGLWGLFWINDWRGKASLPWVVPLLGRGPELYKEGSRAGQGEQASKQRSLMLSASVPASRFLPWVPSLDGGQWFIKATDSKFGQYAFGNNGHFWKHWGKRY